MKVEFEYSGINDNFWKKYLEFYYEVHKKPRTKIILDNYPNSEEVKKYVKNIERSNNNKAYRMAWEIVEEEGYEEIIKKFKEIVKND